MRIHQVHIIVETVRLGTHANIHSTVPTPEQILMGIPHLQVDFAPKVDVQLRNAHRRTVGNLQRRIHPNRHVRSPIVQIILQRVQLLQLNVRVITAFVAGGPRSIGRQHHPVVGHIAGTFQLVWVEDNYDLGELILRSF